MKKLSGKFNVIKSFGEEKIQKWSGELVEMLKKTIIHEADNAEEYVNQLKRLNPGIDNETLVKKIISRRSLKAGGIGALSGVGGIITMPVSMPTDLCQTFRVQALMVLAIAYIYGWNIHNEDSATDILLVMGGSTGINILKNSGIKIGQEFAKKGVKQYITREVMKKINRILSRKIITKAGEKSLTSFTKMIPLVGAPIGGTINYIGTRGIGKTAHAFYKG